VAGLLRMVGLLCMHGCNAYALMRIRAYAWLALLCMMGLLCICMGHGFAVHACMVHVNDEQSCLAVHLHVFNMRPPCHGTKDSWLEANHSQQDVVQDPIHGPTRCNKTN
jgi:hypothetical protein